MFYTQKERTEKDYTIADAVTAARNIIGPTRLMCVNAVSANEYSEKITLQQLNEICERLVDDTNYHSS